MKVKAYLQITMKISNDNRPAAAKVYTDYRQPFLDTIKGALTKDLLIRDEDVQVLHGFDSAENAQAYLSSELFQNDVFVGLKPLWDADPEVKIYTVA
ncbi:MULTISPECIES: hypothetical protein [Ruminococcus]|uniref:DUF1330 domain-containing protein n=1 Tax=Ruminococcus bovis TaxID=2564099 RepID=A0A4P8XVT6_9FIRM|nr:MULTISPECIES: hypothetical protein [Ruminococcus]MEE3439184.1 hypothetical protein [Ruminococcus sp.]QCT06050.1 hypothetical protein E5Z56_01105 [Ruminococcus bovis]